MIINVFTYAAGMLCTGRIEERVYGDGTCYGHGDGDAGRREVAVLTRPLADLSARSRSDLRYCTPGVRGRRTVDVTIATSCDTRPRWQVDALIVWTAFYDAYPGRTELRARAQRLCGPQARVLLPTRADWEAAPATTWCLSWYA